MTLDGLLTELREKKIELWVEGDRLRYRAPDQALTPELLERLRQHKPELINFLRAATPGSESRKPVLQPVARPARLPLSFAQERLWVLDQLEPNRPTYNIPIALRLRGALDVAALELTLNEICRRHEVLRTTFAAGEEGEPWQVIGPALLVPLPGRPCLSTALAINRIASSNEVLPLAAWPTTARVRIFEMSTGIRRSP